MDNSRYTFIVNVVEVGYTTLSYKIYAEPQKVKYWVTRFTPYWYRYDFYTKERKLNGKPYYSGSVLNCSMFSFLNN